MGDPNDPMASVEVGSAGGGDRVEEIDLTAANSADDSDCESILSLSDKIVIESNEKRLRRRMRSLQTSIMSLREQLRVEKELWRDDLEKIRTLQRQQHELGLSKSHNRLLVDEQCMPFKSDSMLSFHNTLELCNIGSHGSAFRSAGHEIIATKALKHLMEMESYKRKLAETENMCNVELSRVKQSLQDLRYLQNVASDWNGARGSNNNKSTDNTQGALVKCDNNTVIQDIFVPNLKQ